MAGFSDAAGNVTGLDLDSPYTNGSRVGIDLWVGYKIPLRDRETLELQLNVRDVNEGGGYRPILANSDGTIAAYRIVTPRTFLLTARYKF